MEKRFMLFVGEYYYPEGGAWDYKGSFYEIQNAIVFFDTIKERDNWAHIFDLKEGRIVMEFTRSAKWQAPEE